MGVEESKEGFARPVALFVAPYLEALEERVRGLYGLAEAERDVVRAATASALRANALLRLNRVFLLELHAAGLSGQLAAGSEQERWARFIELACAPAFSEHLRRRYPTLHARVAKVLQQQLDAVLTLVERFLADRERLAELPGQPGGALRSLSLGAGDTHRGGQSVTRLELERGTVMYKPRPVEVDVALSQVLEQLLPGGPGDERIRVPRVLVREGYGWAEFVAHRYCEGEDELRRFYRHLGHWLAVMRLLGGTDLHSENLIAQGPVPVAVDVESLFAQDAPPPPSGRGEAVDLAVATIRDTVLRTGLLPFRAGGLALAGVDISAVGALPGQQPRIPVPVILDEGSATARLGMASVELPPAGNHPSPRPVLERYWEQIVIGFRELTAHLQGLDARRSLTERLHPFVGCEIRRILRPTQAYTEIGRMLWHPASLHNLPQALERARDILLRNAQALPGAPTAPEEIEREVEDLLAGDIPVFTARVEPARLEAFVRAWRAADLPREEMTIQSALVSAYLNEKVLPPRRQVATQRPHGERREERRRALAAQLVRQLRDAAIRGSDGSATWISPVLTEYGWSIRPLTADVYSGQGGVGLVLAQYVHELRRGRADEVEGVEALLAGTLSVLRATEDLGATPQLGAFLGLGSQVWAWSSLFDLLGEPWMLERARARAALLEQRVGEEEHLLELLAGVAGTIVPLLNLAEQTGEERWLRIAARASGRLEGTARREGAGARWATSMFPEAIGGVAHGATGIGWSLARLSLSAAGTAEDRRRWRELAEAAFAFEESLYRPELGDWKDVRVGSAVDSVAAWCHGSTGIGLVAGDLLVRTKGEVHRDVLRRACAASAREGFGWSHTLCHGDLGTWELLDTARRLDPGYSGPERAWMDAELLSSLEERGAVGGLAREAFSPGLMAGLTGVIHVLLRMHPEQRLASPLLLSRHGA